MKAKTHIIILLILLQSCNKTNSQKEIKKESIPKKEVVVKTDSVKQDTIILKKHTEWKAPPLSKIPSKTIWYKGYLGDVATKYYGNKAYYLPLAVYNNIEDGYRIKKKIELHIPSFSAMVKDANLGLKPTIHKEADLILQARKMYLTHEKELWNLEKVERDKVIVPAITKQELLKASHLIDKAITSLGKVKNPPKKMIGQLKSISKNLQNIAIGKVDENNYDLDMVHQRLAHAFKNGMIWSREK